MNNNFYKYLNINTFFHKLNPLVKLFCFLLYIFITLYNTNIYIYIYILFSLIMLCIFSGFPLKILNKTIYSLRYFILFFLIFNLVFFKQGLIIFDLGLFSIYSETIKTTSIFLFRIVILIILNIIFIVSTKPVELITAVNRRLNKLGNLGPSLGMILTLTINFIPLLQNETLKIMDAQKSRGMTLNKGSIYKRIINLTSILIPLIVISFNKADNLAKAMITRGYSPIEKRTTLYTTTFTKLDSYFIFMSFLFVIFVFYLIYITSIITV